MSRLSTSGEAVVASSGTPAAQRGETDRAKSKPGAGATRKTIWIDLDNSPHIPFFAPIIKELQNGGYTVTLTARDAYQVCELADLFHLSYKRIGRHYGKNKVLKVFGTCLRALQLMSTAVSQRPDLAMAHGSRSQMLTCMLLRIPSICILDYEFADLHVVRPTWVMAPEVIPNSSIRFQEGAVLKYPGIKEDVYAPHFKPDQSIRSQLGLQESDLVATVRPPATEAHYHCQQSEELFRAAIEFLGQSKDVKTILLPRNKKQEASIRAAWPNLVTARKIIIPERALDGLSVIWHSDFVISGGGTMNREAAALGVPVYSIFRGKIGAVDKYLAATGRLVLVENAQEVHTKILVARRQRPTELPCEDSNALKKIVSDVMAILGANCRGQGDARDEQ